MDRFLFSFIFVVAVVLLGGLLFSFFFFFSRVSHPMYAAGMRQVYMNCTFFIRGLILEWSPHSTLLPLASLSVFTFLTPRCTGTSRVPAIYTRYAVLCSPPPPLPLGT